CCCPFLCVAQDPEKVQVPDATLTPTGLSSSSTEGIQAKVQSGPSALPVIKPAGRPGEEAGAGQRLTGASPKTDEAASALQEQGDKGTTGLQSDTNKSAVETDQDAEASAQTTTTTTTKAPTTTTTTTEAKTTTTTTTTTAPEAPSTTTTEALTTTTTAHRHAFAKSTAASAALRGCVPRCCSPYPRWRTPLWSDVNKERKIMIVS
ncbi:putative mucin TcMUCII, partial [Trypanosoma cruzi]